MVKHRKAQTSDALDIARVHVKSWKTTYKNIVPEAYLEKMNYDDRKNMWKDIISNQTVFVAEVNGKIVGFANGGEERTGEYSGYQGELYAIYILESFQQRGIGKQLLDLVAAHLSQMNITSMTVSVLEDNISCTFYERLGAWHIDTVEIEIAGKTLNELVYGWKDISQMNL